MFRLVKQLSQLRRFKIPQAERIRSPYVHSPLLAITYSRSINQYNFAFFKKKFGINHESFLTQSIKNCKITEDIELIIRQNGQNFNIIHLVAILDRQQEQNMINADGIIRFVIQKLKLYVNFFIKTEYSEAQVRHISCVICYLGNLKNYELNFMFQRIKFKPVFKVANNIQKLGFITGLIKLKLFYRFFSEKMQYSPDKLNIKEIVNDTMLFQEILGIWFIYTNEISAFHTDVNLYIINLLQKTFSGHYNLKSFGYLFCVYLKIKNNLQQEAVEVIFKYIKFYTPTEQTKTEMMLPHEFSLLLQALKKYRKQVGESMYAELQINKSGLFEAVLKVNYKRIIRISYLTSRNLASCFRPFLQLYKINNKLIIMTLIKTMNILDQQFQYIQKDKRLQKNTYSMNYKIDLLSLSSLFCKINAKLSFQTDKQNMTQFKVHLESFQDKIVKYIKILHKMSLFQKIQNKSFVMLYNGFFQLANHIEFQLDQEFKQISLSQFLKEERKFSLKEIDFLYSFFKKVKIYNVHFCNYLRSRMITQKNSPQFKYISNADFLLNTKKCLVKMDKACLQCLSGKDKQISQKYVTKNRFFSIQSRQSLNQQKKDNSAIK